MSRTSESVMHFINSIMNLLNLISARFLNLFLPSRCWLAVIFFLVPSAICTAYSAPRGNIHVDLKWSLIGKTILQTGVVYLNVVPLVRKGLVFGVELFEFLILLGLSLGTLAAVWVLWKVGATEWVDVLMSGVDTFLFTASAQWLLAVEDRRKDENASATV